MQLFLKIMHTQILLTFGLTDVLVQFEIPCVIFMATQYCTIVVNCYSAPYNK